MKAKFPFVSDVADGRKSDDTLESRKERTKRIQGKRMVVNSSAVSARQEKLSPKKSNWIWWRLGIVVAIWLLVGVVLFLTKKIEKDGLVAMFVITVFLVPIYVFFTGAFRDISSGFNSLLSKDIFCAGCGKHMKDRAWQCGYCDVKNEFRSFLSACERCDKPPSSIECPHCHLLNAFERSADPRHTARIYRSKSESLGSILDQLQKQFEPHEEKVKSRQNEIELVHLDTALEAAKNDWREQRSRRKIPSNPKSSGLDESLDAFLRRTRTVQEIAAKELRKAEKEYGDDPQELARHKMAVQSWAADELAKQDE